MPFQPEDGLWREAGVQGSTQGQRGPHGDMHTCAHHHRHPHTPPQALQSAAWQWRERGELGGGWTGCGALLRDGDRQCGLDHAGTAVVTRIPSVLASHIPPVATAPTLPMSGYGVLRHGLHTVRCRQHASQPLGPGPVTLPRPPTLQAHPLACCVCWVSVMCSALVCVNIQRPSTVDTHGDTPSTLHRFTKRLSCRSLPVASTSFNAHLFF